MLREMWLLTSESPRELGFIRCDVSSVDISIFLPQYAGGSGDPRRGHDLARLMVLPFAHEIPEDDGVFYLDFEKKSLVSLPSRKEYPAAAFLERCISMFENGDIIEKYVEAADPLGERDLSYLQIVEDFETQLIIESLDYFFF